MEALMRLFGRKEESSPKKAPKKGSGPVASFESMYRYKGLLDLVTEAYTKRIEEEAKKVRYYTRKSLNGVAAKHFARRKELEIKLEKHTDLVICLDGIVDLVRTAETQNVSLVGMDMGIALIKKFTDTLNYENADRIRSELEENQRKISEIQRLVTKPMKGAPVLDDSVLLDEMEDFLARPDSEEETTDEVAVTQQEQQQRPKVEQKKQLEALV
jgi:hypothetical protein